MGARAGLGDAPHDGGGGAGGGLWLGLCPHCPCGAGGMACGPHGLGEAGVGRRSPARVSAPLGLPPASGEDPGVFETLGARSLRTQRASWATWAGGLTAQVTGTEGRRESCRPAGRSPCWPERVRGMGRHRARPGSAQLVWEPTPCWAQRLPVHQSRVRISLSLSLSLQATPSSG